MAAKEDDLEKLQSKKKRLEGTGRKPGLPDIKEQLAAWVEGRREENLRVTRASIVYATHISLRRIIIGQTLTLKIVLRIAAT